MTTRGFWQDEEVVLTRGAGLTIAVAPHRGGKIVSLLDDEGVEWLAQPEPGPLSPPASAGSRFIDGEMCGWDECAPTIVACTIAGNQLPDHGDLWTSRFDVDGATVSTRGSSVPYRFSRRAVATPEGIRLQYEAVALEGPLPFLWAAHPQFLAPSGTHVVLDPMPHGFLDVLAEGAPRLLTDPRLLGIDTVDSDGCRKLYLAPETRCREASLVRASGRRLVMRWSGGIPYLGLWYDAGAYSREPVIAIEPTSGYYDSLELAVWNGRAARLEPGRATRWWIELRAE